jgi:chromosome segregation ATPase
MEAADSPELQADTIKSKTMYKLFKEKVGRNQDVYEFRLKALENENEFLKTSFQKQNEHFQALENALKEKQKELEQVKQTNFELEKLQDRLKIAHEIVLKDKETAEKSNLELRERSRVFEERLGDLRKEFKKSRKLSKSVEKGSVMNQEKSEQEKRGLKQTIDELRDQVRTSTLLVAALETENKNLLANLQVKEKKDIEVGFELKNIQREADELKAQLRYANQELLEKNGIIKELEGFCNELKDNIKKSKKKLKKKLAAEQEAMKEATAAHERQTKQLEDKLESKQEQILKLTGNIKDLQKTIDDLDKKAKKMPALKSNSLRLEQSVIDYERLLNDKNRLLSENGSTIQQMIKETESLQLKLQSAKEENELLRSLKQTLESESHELGQTLREQVLQIQSLSLESEKRREEKLRNEIDKENQARTYEQKIDQLIQQTLALQSDIERLGHKDLAQQRTINEMQSKIDQLSSAKREKKTEVRLLQDQVTNLKQQICERDFELMRFKGEMNTVSKHQETNARKIGVVNDIKGIISCYKNLNK